VSDAGGWRRGLSVAEDQELWLRVSSYGPVAIVPDSVLLHRPHGLEGDVADGREIERSIVSAYLRSNATFDRRGRRATEAREHLRDAHVEFQLGRYRRALADTVRGVVVAPFLLVSPLVGPGITWGLMSALVAAVLPRAAANRLRTVVRRRRATSFGRL
jgi:hypothetical protein